MSNYYEIKKNSVGNWLGISVSIYFSGCPIRCKGCFNSVAWNPNSGQEFTDKVKDEVFKELEKSYYDNLVILGGEPTAEYNIETVTELAKEFKEKFPNKKLIVFSGHVIEDIYDYKLLKYIDILVDGQFIEELYSPLLFFKGSSNQRTIDVQETLKTGKVVLYHE